VPYGHSGFFLSFSFSLLAASLVDTAVGFEAGFAGSFLAIGLLSTLLVVTSLIEAFYMYRIHDTKKCISYKMFTCTIAFSLMHKPFLNFNLGY
jgi:hypothetical protein